MRKSVNKIVKATVAVAMMIGAGVGAAVSGQKAKPVYAATSDIVLNWSDFGISGTTTQTNVTEEITGYTFTLSSATGANGISKSGNMVNALAFPGSITKIAIDGAHFSAETKGHPFFRIL